MKVGVIGAGNMGRNHARIYADMPDVELTGISDINHELAQGLANKLHTAAFENYDELLHTGLDAVSIAVPTSLHKKVAIDAARAGVNILVEKPIADTVKNAGDILTAARENGISLMVGQIERFNPVTPVIKKAIENRKVNLIEITRIGPVPPQINDVGVVIDLAVHDIDLIRYFTNSEFKNIYSVLSNHRTRHEDAAIMIFETANGVLARITVNWLTPFKVREINIATEDKFIQASLIGQTVTEYSRQKTDNSYIVRELPVTKGEPLRIELEAFISSIKKSTPPPVTGEDGLKNLEIAIKCLSDKEISHNKMSNNR